MGEEDGVYVFFFFFLLLSCFCIHNVLYCNGPPSQNNLPNDSEDDFYDAFDSPPPVPTHMMDPMQSYSDMNDSCMLFQSHDHLEGLSWSQEESGLLDEGAGEAAFAEDLTIVRNGPWNGHVVWLLVVMQPTYALCIYPVLTTHKFCVLDINPGFLHGTIY